MNKIESVVYNLVRKNPALKQVIRNLYQSAFDLLPKEKDFFSDKYQFKEGFFFGFHDISPFSQDESKLLSNKLTFDLKMPLPKESLSVGYFDFINNDWGEFHEMGKSMAWNYHKGCRLQWLDNQRAIFNTAQNNMLCSEIVDILSKERKLIEYPIDAVYKNKATSFSYERLERCMPGYGYPYQDNGFLSQPAPKNTGVFIIDLTTGKRELLLSIYDIAIHVTGKIENQYLHFVTHTEFSKDGRYVSFLYRRIPKEDNYMKRRSVICVYDLIDQKLIVLPSQESGSHYVWNDNNQIIASCIIDGESCHVLFDMNNVNDYKIISPKILNSDGHQSFLDNTQFVTDTYPDRRRMARIYKADIKSNSVTLLAKVYSPKKFQTKDFKCHIACDLHPRVSPSGKYICFDSPRSGKRALYVMKL